MSNGTNHNVLQLSDWKSVEDIIRSRYGNEFIIGFINKETGNFHSFISDDLYDKDLCYLIDALNQHRVKRNA